MKDFKIVIPARYGATRLPGKPLQLIAGRPLLEHVIARARASSAEEIIVATDDERILNLCLKLDVKGLLTASTHRSGSERIAAVVTQCNWSADTVIINLQGDEPGMPAVLIDQLACALINQAELGMATLGYPIRDSAVLFDPHVVKVVTDVAGFALYFSRAPIPWYRDGFMETKRDLPENLVILRHLGIYAYRARFLQRFITWAPAPLELIESLEQLRVLWHGERIYLSIATCEPGPGVDTPEDLIRAEKYLINHLNI